MAQKSDSIHIIAQKWFAIHLNMSRLSSKCGQKIYYSIKIYINDLKGAMMKNNFKYIVLKSTTKWWYIWCKDNLFDWSVHTECLDESTLSINVGQDMHVLLQREENSEKNKFCKNHYKSD